MKTPAQLKTLDDLLAQANHYAEFCLRNSGTMTPTLFLIGDHGPLMLVPEAMGDEKDKDTFADMARLTCIAHKASTCVMAMEAWLKTAKPGEPFDLTEPPSEAFDRQEVVVLMGEDRNRQRQQFLNIVRSDNGKFFGLTTADVPAPDKMTGRFTSRSGEEIEAQLGIGGLVFHQLQQHLLRFDSHLFRSPQRPASLWPDQHPGWPQLDQHLRDVALPKL